MAAVQEADCVLINTCGFIESAKQEAIDTILEAVSYTHLDVYKRQAGRRALL